MGCSSFQRCALLQHWQSLRFPHWSTTKLWCLKVGVLVCLVMCHAESTCAMVTCQACRSPSLTSKIQSNQIYYSTITNVRTVLSIQWLEYLDVLSKYTERCSIQVQLPCTVFHPSIPLPPFRPSEHRPTSRSNCTGLVWSKRASRNGTRKRSSLELVFPLKKDGANQILVVSRAFLPSALVSGQPPSKHRKCGLLPRPTCVLDASARLVRPKSRRRLVRSIV